MHFRLNPGKPQISSGPDFGFILYSEAIFCWFVQGSAVLMPLFLPKCAVYKVNAQPGFGWRRHYVGMIKVALWDPAGDP